MDISEYDLRVKATNNAICRAMEQRFRNHPDESARPELLQKWLDLAREGGSDTEVQHWFHLTISGDSSLDLIHQRAFLERVQHLSEQKHVLQGLWAPEYCDDAGVPSHVHAHFVLQSSYSKSNLIKRASEVMRVAPNFIDCRPKKTVTAVRNALIYAQKNRTPDVVWRDALGVPPYTLSGSMTEESLSEWVKPPV